MSNECLLSHGQHIFFLMYSIFTHCLLVAYNVSSFHCKFLGSFVTIGERKESTNSKHSISCSMCHYLMSNYYFNGIYCHNKHHILYIVQCNGWNHKVNLTHMSTSWGFMCEKNHVLLYLKIAHMDSEVLLQETQLWADPKVPALELTFRNSCQFSRLPHIQQWWLNGTNPNVP
jgi:hypothetical protein